MTKEKSKSNNLNKQAYDAYFEENGTLKSMYQEQFLDRVNFRTTEIVGNLAKGLYKRARPNEFGERVLRICDFGAGDGRFLKIIENAASSMKERDIKVELVAYEPNARGLQHLISKATKKNYDKIAGEGFDKNREDKPFREKGYEVGKWQKDNLTITAIHGHEDDKVTHIAKLIGNVDMTICMFGVLSHIPTSIRRIVTLGMFGDITNGPVVLTVPADRRFAKERKIFDAMKNGNYDAFDGAVSEEGDLVYTRTDKDAGTHVQNYIHTYKASELRNAFTVARLEIIGGVQAEKIFNEKNLVRSKCLSAIDGLISKNLPESMADKFAEYFIVVAERPIMQKRGKPFLSMVNDSGNETKLFPQSRL